jgi:hypothetical protein
MSTSKSLLLLAQRAWRRELTPDGPGRCDLPMAIRERWWTETDYGQKPLRATAELVELLKNFRAAPRPSSSHPPMRRKTETWVFGGRSYAVTVRARGDEPFLVRIMPSDVPTSPTMARTMIGGEGQQFLLCVERTVPIELVRSALARLIVTPPKLLDVGGDA